MVRDGLVCTNRVSLDPILWNVREQRFVKIVKEFDRDLTAAVECFNTLFDSLLVVENLLGVFCLRLTCGSLDSGVICVLIETTGFEAIEGIIVDISPSISADSIASFRRRDV